MKYINKCLIAFLVVSVMASCTKDFETINTNPNSPTAVPNTNLLISGISRSIERIHGSNMNLTYAGLWSQHYAKIQYIDEDWYSYRTASMDAHWDGLYAGPLADLQDILNDETASANMRGAAMTMKAHIMSVMTDMWGMVPYSQALQGTDFIQPVYDSQESIYMDLVSQLESAAGMFSADGGDLGVGDIIYGGDPMMWKKFANSLRARLLNRYAHKDAGAASALAALLGNPGDLIASNAENAMMAYPDATDNPNQFYENKYLDGRDDHAVSETLVNTLLAINDPRLPVFAAPATNDGMYRGQPNGTTEPASFGDISRIGTAFRDDPNAPSAIMTYSEVLFIMAEANQDKQMYLDAIAASCDQHGVTADQPYLDDAGAFFDGGADQAIATHKWVSLFGNGCEAYTEYRRTGFPALVEVPGSVYPNMGVPLRLPYPTVETTTNGANLDQAIQMQNLEAASGFVYGNKMWWAK